MVAEIIAKADRMAARLIDDFNTRNWTDHLDDHFYTDKTGYFKKNWKWLDRYTFHEIGYFHEDVVKQIGASAWMHEVRPAIQDITSKVHEAVPLGLDLADPTRGPIYCLINYLMAWAPAEVLSRLAPRILDAFPKQGILAGVVGNDLDGQLIVFRPSGRFITELGNHIAGMRPDR
ncbi:MAG: hypothetical protein H0W78_06555 [Planctomycetes bacterium]|nr:hypothetical protein [Planctomycetota bacterium]